MQLAADSTQLYSALLPLACRLKGAGAFESSPACHTSTLPSQSAPNSAGGCRPHVRAEGRAGRGSRPFTTRTEDPTRQRKALPRAAFPTLGLPKVMHLQQAGRIHIGGREESCPTCMPLQLMRPQTQPPQAMQDRGWQCNVAEPEVPAIYCTTETTTEQQRTLGKLAVAPKANRCTAPDISIGPLHGCPEGPCSRQIDLLTRCCLVCTLLSPPAGAWL